MLEMLEKAYIRFRIGMKKRFAEFKSDERGMATVEMVILIVIAVLIVGVVVNLLTDGGFQDSAGNDCGLIKYLFDKMKTSLTGTFKKAEDAAK